MDYFFQIVISGNFCFGKLLFIQHVCGLLLWITFCKNWNSRSSYLFCKYSFWIICFANCHYGSFLCKFCNSHSSYLFLQIALLDIFFANCHLFENMSSCPHFELKLRCFHSSGSVRLFGRNSEGNCLSKIPSHSVEVHQRKSGIPTVLTTIIMFIITIMIIVVIWMIIIIFIPLSPPRLSNLDRHE